MNQFDVAEQKAANRLEKVGTLTLKKISEAKKVEAKVARKKTDIVSINVTLDGEEYFMNFSVPMSMSLLSGQKTQARISEIFRDMLIGKFGKAEKI
jgi:hypothetical protein